MLSSSYSRSNIRQFIDNQADTLPKDERCDDYYKLWWNTYKDVLKYWEPETITTLEQLREFL